MVWNQLIIMKLSILFTQYGFWEMNNEVLNKQLEIAESTLQQHYRSIQSSNNRVLLKIAQTYFLAIGPNSPIRVFFTPAPPISQYFFLNISNFVGLINQTSSIFIFHSNHMIYQQHQPEHDTSLFNSPEQLLLLRDNLTQLIRRKQNGRDDPLLSTHRYYPQQQQSQQTQSISQLLRIQHQHEELIADLSSQISTLGQISIKMIDQITEIQQKRTDQVLHYEDSIENLKAQLECATHKNHLIEGDIEVFRERLLVAQQEMEEIQRNEPTPSYELESESKIEQLQRQLHKIKEQLNIYRAQQPKKEIEVVASGRGLSYHLSEKYIHNIPPAEIASDPYLQAEEIEQLHQRIQDLEQQNYQLRYEIDCLQNSQYPHEQLQVRELEDNQVNPFAEQCNTEVHIEVLQHYDDHTLNKATSSNVLVQMRREKAQMAPNMVSYQSVEKFHTLSNEWSTKSLQNIMMFNMQALHNKLIYLNEQQRNCIPQTRQTENSQPDSDMNFKQRAKSYKETGVNTDLPEQMQPNNPQIEQEQTQQDAIVEEGSTTGRLNKSVRRLFDGFWSLKARVVDNRIGKAAHQPKGRHRRNISYY